MEMIWIGNRRYWYRYVRLTWEVVRTPLRVVRTPLGVVRTAYENECNTLVYQRIKKCIGLRYTYIYAKR